MKYFLGYDSEDWNSLSDANTDYYKIELRELPLEIWAHIVSFLNLRDRVRKIINIKSWWNATITSRWILAVWTCQCENLFSQKWFWNWKPKVWNVPDWVIDTSPAGSPSWWIPVFSLRCRGTFWRWKTQGWFSSCRATLTEELVVREEHEIDS